VEYLLHRLLQRSAEDRPEQVAVEDGARAISYAELDARSSQVAHLLQELGVSKGDRVGLYLNKSLESIVGIYGILKAGAAYVPFDAQAPLARLAYIAGNCGIRVMLTGTEKSGTWAELVSEDSAIDALVALNGQALRPEDLPSGVMVLSASAVDDQPETASHVEVIDIDLAYILYTSGSTGVPKGVMLSHLNALTFVRWVVDRFSVRAEDRLSNHAPLHFDLTILDVFASAGAAATVVLVPQETSVFPVEVRRFIEEKRITIWYSVPSVLSMLVQRGSLHGGEFPHLRTLFFAGEMFPTKYLRSLMRFLPQVEFLNLYGPTETNVCTYYHVPRLPDDQTEPIPIGKAIDNVEVFAVTDDGRVADPGEIGELYVRGTTVMHGYWGDRERTARGLIPNPHGGQLHDPVYKTGDLVRQDADGNYHLLGRRDHQIKSRGYRIELGDIETALYAHPGVIECAVIAVPDNLITNRVAAFVVARDGVTQQELAGFCRDRIPHYMIPEEFRFVGSLPKTSTGKIDRSALADDVAQAAGGTR
jgi:amino acid adenylation domain-containing protein